MEPVLTNDKTESEQLEEALERMEMWGFWRALDYMKEHGKMPPRKPFNPSPQERSDVNEP